MTIKVPNLTIADRGDIDCPLFLSKISSKRSKGSATFDVDCTIGLALAPEEVSSAILPGLDDLRARILSAVNDGPSFESKLGHLTDSRITLRAKQGDSQHLVCNEVPAVIRRLEVKANRKGLRVEYRVRFVGDLALLSALYDVLERDVVPVSQLPLFSGSQGSQGSQAEPVEPSLASSVDSSAPPTPARRRKAVADDTPPVA